MLSTCLLLALFAAPTIASTCVSVPTPTEANAARSQTSLFQGDVLLTINQRTPLAGIDKTDASKIEPILKNLIFPWKNNTIPYMFLVDFPQTKKDTVLQAMNYWQSVSCVTFRPATPNDYEYLLLSATAGNPGCYSNLGMVQESSFITNINMAGCDSFAVATDLLAHSLGVYNTGGVDLHDKPTVGTIAQVNELYKCSAACPSPISCLNGGSPSGKSCSSCVCPAGWSGAKCDETSSGTQLVQVIHSRDVSLNLNGVFTAAEEKVVIVQAPAGKKLQATVTTFGPNCFSSCSLAGLDITGSQTDKTVCSLPSTTFLSTGNSLTLRLFRSANYQVQTIVTLTVV